MHLGEAQAIRLWTASVHAAPYAAWTTGEGVRKIASAETRGTLPTLVIKHKSTESLVHVCLDCNLIGRANFVQCGCWEEFSSPYEADNCSPEPLNFLITNRTPREWLFVTDVIALDHYSSETLWCSLGGLPNFEFVVYVDFLGVGALILSCCTYVRHATHQETREQGDTTWWSGPPHRLQTKLPPKVFDAIERDSNHQEFHPVLGVGSGGRFVEHSQAPMLYWMNVSLQSDGLIDDVSGMEQPLCYLSSLGDTFPHHLTCRSCKQAPLCIARVDAPRP